MSKKPWSKETTDRLYMVAGRVNREIYDMLNEICYKRRITKVEALEKAILLLNESYKHKKEPEED